MARGVRWALDAVYPVVPGQVQGNVAGQPAIDAVYPVVDPGVIVSDPKP